MAIDPDMEPILAELRKQITDLETRMTELRADVEAELSRAGGDLMQADIEFRQALFSALAVADDKAALLKRLTAAI